MPTGARDKPEVDLIEDIQVSVPVRERQELVLTEKQHGFARAQHWTETFDRVHKIGWSRLTAQFDVRDLHIGHPCEGKLQHCHAISIGCGEALVEVRVGKTGWDEDERRKGHETKSLMADKNMAGVDRVERSPIQHSLHRLVVVSSPRVNTWPPIMTLCPSRAPFLRRAFSTPILRILWSSTVTWNGFSKSVVWIIRSR